MVEKVCCAIYRKNYDSVKFLILHKNNWWNGWEFVRGEAESSEGIMDAAVREVNQETGLNITDIKVVPFNYSYNYLKNLNYISAEVSCFLAKASDELVTLSSEHNHYKWVDYETAMKLLEFPEQKKLLEQVNRLINH
ncbi:MAG: NUDIX domain-containing protein [Nanoarchaeota archaeon]|nr:NUDIX domain-containing protein [Nanoarchaeota archaeon]